MLTESQEKIKDAVRTLITALPPNDRRYFLNDLLTIEGMSPNNWRRDVVAAVNSLEDALNS